MFPWRPQVGFGCTLLLFLFRFWEIVSSFRYSPPVSATDFTLEKGGFFRTLNHVKSTRPPNSHQRRGAGAQLWLSVAHGSPNCSGPEAQGLVTFAADHAAGSLFSLVDLLTHCKILQMAGMFGRPASPPPRCKLRNLQPSATHGWTRCKSPIQIGFLDCSIHQRPLAFRSRVGAVSISYQSWNICCPTQCIWRSPLGHSI